MRKCVKCLKLLVSFFNFIIEMTHKSEDYKILAVKYYLKMYNNII